MRIARLFVGIGVSMVLAACTDGGEKSDPLSEACVEVRHLAAEYWAQNTVRSHGDLARQHREQLKHVQNAERALGDAFVAECKRMGPSYVTCAQYATSSDELHACKQEQAL